VWYDAVMTSPERVLIEILRWACSCGAEALNYVEATGLITRAGAVAGVLARDRATGAPLEFHAPVVINAAGPWSRDLAARFDRDVPALFKPSLAFNLLLDLPAPCPMAVGVSSGAPGARTYFLVPVRGRLLAGTFHAPCEGGRPTPEPTDTQIGAFLDDLAAAAPGLRPAPRHILAVLGGLLPAVQAGSVDQADRPVIVEHGRTGGPAGLWSVSGVKYTTARAVAERLVRRAFPARWNDKAPRPASGRPAARPWPGLLDVQRFLETPPAEAAAYLQCAVAEESVLHLEDLVLRRAAWGAVPDDALAAGRRAAELLGYDAPTRIGELRRLERILGVHAARPIASADAPVAHRSRAMARGGAA
jgi:glycerol-3-phosphate dehydrogenase